MRKTPRFSCTQRRSGARTRGHASHTLPRSKRPETSSDSPHASWLKEIALCRAFVGARRSESSEHSKSERAPVVQKNFFFLRVWRSSLQQKYFCLVYRLLSHVKLQKDVSVVFTIICFLCVWIFLASCISSSMYMQVAIRHGKEVSASRGCGRQVQKARHEKWRGSGAARS